MNPPMINYINSVSTTKRKREAERSVNWTLEETQVLLCAWSNERVQKSLAENLRNRHVFKHLSARMSEMGFSRSPHQCRLRVKTLKANYVRAKLQRSMDTSQPCSFKYFAEMDAVLGRRSAGGVDGTFLVSPEQMSEGRPVSVDGTGSVQQDFNFHTQIGAQRFSASARTGGKRLSSLEARGAEERWQLDSEVKMEERENSEEELEFTDEGFSPCPRVRGHNVYLESAAHRRITGASVRNSLRTPSPNVVPPPPPQSPPPAASPLPAPPDPGPSSFPSSGYLHLDSSRPQPALQHLLESFQRLMSETRGLLVQLEGQRQEQTRWHRDVLSQWLQREERRQRETAEREERRERARMEHEIRVLELLGRMTREHTCHCEGGGRGRSWATGRTRARAQETQTEDRSNS